MRKCNKCNISYNGNLRYCPLCQSDLVGDKTPNVFPIIKPKKKYFFYKFLFFIFALISMTCGFVEYNVAHQFIVTNYMIVSLTTIYIFLVYFLNYHSDLFAVINRVFLISFWLLIMWYFVLRESFIPAFLLPCLCLAIFLFNDIMIIIKQDRYVTRYAKFLFVNLLFSVLTISFVIFKAVTFKMLIYVVVFVDIVNLLSLVTFYKEALIEEFKKFFNI